jgi:TetR/AcrR family transcriptional regulator, regulator of biofilm formation and stress response
MAYLSNDIRREQFIEAASIVIHDHGLKAATTRRIADQAGAPLGSLHYCFRTKEELFVAVGERLGEGGHLLAAERITDQMGTPVAARIILETFGQFLAKPENQTLSEYEIYIWALQNRKHHDMPTQIYLGWIRRVREMLERAAKPAEPPRDMDKMARFVLAQVDGYYWQCLLLKDDTMPAALECAGVIVERSIEGGAFDISETKEPKRNTSRATKTKTAV